MVTGHEVDITKYGEGTGPTHIENIFCYGSETSILDCRYSSDTIFFDDRDAPIGLLCYKREYPQVSPHTVYMTTDIVLLF